MKKGCAIWSVAVVGLFSTAALGVYFRWLNFPEAARKAEDLYAELDKAGQLPTLAELSPPLKPGEVDALPFLREASNAKAAADAEKRDSPHPAAFLEYVKSAPKKMALLRDASNATRLLYNPEGRPLVSEFSDLVLVKEAVKLLSRHGKVLAAARQDDLSISEFQAARRIVCLSDQIPTTLGGLVTAGVAKILLRNCAMAAGDRHSDPAYLARLRGVLESDFPRFDCRRQIAGDLWLSLATIRQMSPPWVKNDWLSESDDFSLLPKFPKETGLPSGLIARALSASSLEIYRDQLEALSTPSQAILDISSRINKASRSWERNQEDQPVIYGPQGQNPYPRSYIVIQTAKSERAATLAYILVLQHKLKWGKLPQTSAEVTGYPLDPVTERPVSYRVSERGFRVWSTGPDLQDDGGVSKRENPKAERSDSVIVYPFESIKAKS